jgi:hypothetical protein
VGGLVPADKGVCVNQLELPVICELGLFCPICGKWSEVVHTLKGPGTVVRKRKCANGHTFATEERVTSLDVFRLADTLRLRRRRINKA